MNAESVVESWIQYLEHFGQSDIGIHILLDWGYSFEEIVALFERAIELDIPLQESMGDRLRAE